MTRLIVLDRDGVINHDSESFIKSADEWRAIDGSLEAIARLSQAGFNVAVASNQSGIGRGLLTENELSAIHDKLRDQLSALGGMIGHIVYCPHLPESDCDCRKPKPGMLLEISEHYGVPLEDVPVIGDSLRDLQAAQAVGATPLLVLTGNGIRTQEQLRESGGSVATFDDLRSAVDSLLGQDG